MPPGPRFRPPPGLPFWIAHTAFWLATFATAMLLVRAFRPALADPGWFIGSRVLAGFCITAALRAVARRHGLLDRLGVSKVGIMVGGPLVGAIVMTLAGVAFDGSVGGAIDPATGGGMPPPRVGLAARFVLNLMPLGTWAAAYFGSQLLRDQQATEMRAFEAEALAARNELNQLQAQISPHFLFNALNTILACRQSPDDIETITQSLAKYLRFLLRPTPTLEPLGREIDALEEYLTIQSFRFGDRLACRIECDADIRRIPVLPVMIQPLVENALKYGESGDGHRLEVSVRAFREGDRLLIEVGNTGRWLPSSPAGSTQTGLHALRRRLLLHGGPEATVTTAEEGGRVLVTIRIPLDRQYALPSAPVETLG